MSGRRYGSLDELNRGGEGYAEVTRGLRARRSGALVGSPEEDVSPANPGKPSSGLEPETPSLPWKHGRRASMARKAEIPLYDAEKRPDHRAGAAVEIRGISEHFRGVEAPARRGCLNSG